MRVARFRMLGKQNDVAACRSNLSVSCQNQYMTRTASCQLSESVHDNERVANAREQPLWLTAVEKLRRWRTTLRRELE